MVCPRRLRTQLPTLCQVHLPRNKQGNWGIHHSNGCRKKGYTSWATVWQMCFRFFYMFDVVSQRKHLVNLEKWKWKTNPSLNSLEAAPKQIQPYFLSLRLKPCTVAKASGTSKKSDVSMEFKSHGQKEQKPNWEYVLLGCTGLVRLASSKYLFRC